MLLSSTHSVTMLLANPSEKGKLQHRFSVANFFSINLLFFFIYQLKHVFGLNIFISNQLYNTIQFSIIQTLGLERKQELIKFFSLVPHVFWVLKRTASLRLFF